MTTHAITVLGRDRPGIIAETTRRLASLGLNIEDTSMTRLRGHFAMTLVCAGDAGQVQIATELAPLSANDELVVTVFELPDEPATTELGMPYVLTVHGGDRPGIVSSVTEEIAEVGGNITDLTTRLAGELYVLVAEIDMPPAVDVAALQRSIGEVAASLGVEATLRAVEADEL